MVNVEALKKLFYLNRCSRIFKSQDRKILRRMNNYANKIRPLSSVEEREIKSFFIFYGLKTNILFHTFMVAVNGEYSKRYIHPGLFYTEIEPILNDRRLCQAWADKNYYQMFFPEIRFPDTIVRCISGQLYNAAYTPIDKEQMLALCREHEKVAVKPSIDSGGGNAVKLMEVGPGFYSDLTPYLYEGDFIIQKVEEQHASMAQLNESSINIVRIISVLINGEVIIVTTALRVGAPGSFNDNYIDKYDKSMLTIGVDKNGCLKERAFFASGESVNCCLNGYHFAGQKIIAYDEMIAIIKKLHPKLAHFGLVSWDFFVGEDGHASVMEYNINWQGIAYYQYANGPLFGEETERILSYVAERRKLNRK